jgi:GAF domain-containing protein/HAMP domain-containing protein
METKRLPSQSLEITPAQQPRRGLFFSLRAKMIVAFTLVALIPLGVMAYLDNRTLTVDLTHAANQTLLATASQTAASLDAYINSVKNTLNVEAQLPVLSNLLSLPSEMQPGSSEEKEASSLLKDLQRRGYILSYSLINRQGQVLLDTSASEPGKLAPFLGLDRADPQHFMLSFTTGLPYASPVIFEPGTGTPTIYYLAVVNDKNRNAIGALISKYNASTLQPFVVDNNNLAGEGSFAVLLDENQLRLAQGVAIQDLYKTVAPVDPEKLVSLQQVGRLPPGNGDTVSTDYRAFEQGLIDSTDRPNFTAQESSTGSELNLAGVAQLKSQPWLVAFMQPQSAFLAPVRKQTRDMALLALVIAGVSTAAAILVAQLLSNPIRRLTHVAEKVTAGDLQAQADIHNADEIGNLALAFNSMTRQLRRTLESLEQRVADRTQALALTSEKSERRANQLQTLAGVAHTITSIEDPELLLRDVTHLISQQFCYDHVAIFLLDKSGEYAVLRASNSEAGQKMLAQGYRLKIGQPGILNEAIMSGGPRSNMERSSVTGRSETPTLEFARSEVACPLMLAGKVVGILDVQSARSEAFHTEDIEVFKILADQVAIAIQNSNLFSETRRTLAELQALHRHYLSQEWDRVTAMQNVRGFQIEQGMISPLPAEVPPHDESNTVPNSAAGPAGRSFQIAVRGEVIGMLNLEKNDSDADWNPEDISLVESVVDQLGIALENARLLDEVTRRAAREEQINRIATNVRSSVNTEIILQNTVREVGKALGAARAYIQLTPQKEPAASEIEESIPA